MKLYPVCRGLYSVWGHPYPRWGSHTKPYLIWESRTQPGEPTSHLRGAVPHLRKPYPTWEAPYPTLGSHSSFGGPLSHLEKLYPRSGSHTPLGET